MKPHSRKLIALYANITEMHNHLFHEVSDIEASCKRSMREGTEEISDASLVLRKVAEYCDAMRKECNKKLATIHKIGCLMATSRNDLSMKGELSTSRAEPGETTLLPNPDTHPAEYQMLMVDIGVPKELASNPAIRPSFSGCEELVNKIRSEGKKLPPGLENCRRIPKFSITARPKSGIDLDALAQQFLSNSTVSSEDQSSEDPINNQGDSSHG